MDATNCAGALPSELWSAVLGAVDRPWRPVAARVCRRWRGIVLNLGEINGPRPPSDVPLAQVESLRLRERLAGVRQRAAHRGLWLGVGLLVEAAALPQGAIDMLAWLRGEVKGDSNITPAAPRPIPWHPDATKAASGAGNLAALVWLDARGCPLDARRCAAAAAAKGHLAVLGWLRRWHEAASPLEPSAPLWDETVHRAAGSCGRIDVLRWLDIEGCPRSPMAFVEAARAGHLDVVRWLAATNGRVGAFVRPPLDAACKAAKRGDVAMIECLYVAGCERMDHPCLTEVAAAHGHVAVLAWLRTRLDPPCPWSRYTAPRALMGGHLDAFDWLVRAGCIIDANCFGPAACGNIPLLAWLRRGDDDEDDCRARDAYHSLIADRDDDDPITRAQKEAVRRLPGLPKACDWGGFEYVIYLNAACYGDVRTLDWLRAHGLVLTEYAAHDSFTAAIACGRVGAAGWMADAVPGVCLSRINRVIQPIADGLTRTLGWLHDNGIAWPPRSHSEASRSGQVGVLAWMYAKEGLRLRENDAARAHGQACNRAAQAGQIDAVDWLVDVGFHHDPALVMMWAVERACYGLLKWCRTAWEWPWSSDIAAAAADNHPAPFVGALRDSGCPWDTRVAATYATRGDLDSLVALGPAGRPTDPCPCDQSAIDAAIQKGHPHIAAYLHRFVYPDDAL
ncbi:Ankyrin repeat protein [Pandoravirus kuranda]|uniref:Ankyrin repeat protein n=1 Tax=Pandoravirus kuranda TaxID=3019033 RepID=A0AA95EE01_9VIRU|nr:Ankyrin repeat protein [Pandoravirus kuranda]